MLRWLTSDSPDSRVVLYLRMLYSATYADAGRAVLCEGWSVPARNRRFLLTVDFKRLEVERRARVSSLAAAVRRSLQPLSSLLSAEEVRSWVDRFAATDDFWEPRGRSLGENLCLFLVEEFRRQDRGFLGEVARLSGVLSGLVAQPRAASPWGAATRFDNAAEAERWEAEETYEATWRLLDDEGALPGPNNAGLLTGQPGRHRISVRAFPEGTCSVRSQALEPRAACR